MLFTSRLKEGMDRSRRKNSLRAALASDPTRLASAVLNRRLAEDRLNEGPDVLAERRRQLLRRHTSTGGMDCPETSSPHNRSASLSSAEKRRKGLPGSASSHVVRLASKSSERRRSSLKEERKGSYSATSTPAHRHKTGTIPEEPMMTAIRAANQMMEGGPPAMPPPPLPEDAGAWGAPPALPNSTSAGGGSNGWGDVGAVHETPAYQPPPPTSYQTQPSSATNDGDDFDWSDDDNEARGSAVRRSRDASTDDDASRGVSASRSRHESTDREDSRDEPPPESPLHSFPSQDNSRSDPPSHALAVPGRGGSTDGVERRGTVKKSLNRFSTFVKSGTEAYILQQTKLRSEPAERHEIILSGTGAEWAPLSRSSNFSVRVDKPKKESKMHGLKSFIAYQLTPASTGIQVSRRYKHFDWLLARLSEKYAVLPVPPLPEKQVSGRYEEEFIEHRMQLLQLWVDKIARHPVLATSDVWQHFITCTDEKKWKEGKRRAEKDEYTGGNFFLSITVPSRPIEVPELEGRVDSFSHMTTALEDGVKKLNATAADGAKKMSQGYKREWQKMGGAFHQLGAAFELDEATKGDAVGLAVSKTAENFFKVAGLFAEQPKKDLEPLQDHLFAYKGILTAIPDMVTTHRSAVARLREHEKLKADGKISQSELDGIQNRVDTIGYTLQAEIANFHGERKHDFNHMMTHFLKAQVEFYKQVVDRLQDSLSQFEE